MILNLDYFLFIYLFFFKIRKIPLQQGHMSKAIFD